MNMNTLSTEYMVTDRKGTDEALRLTQFAMDHAGEEVFLIDQDARLLYVNEKVCQALGYTRNELLSMTVHDINPSVQKAAWPAHWQEVGEKRSFTFESVHRTKEGKLFPVEVTANRLEFGGKELNCTLVHDITERKQVEQALADAHRQLQTILDNIPDRIYFKDTQSRFLKLSKGLAQRLRVEDPAQAIGKTDRDFFPPESAEEFYQDEQRIIQTGQPLINKIEKQTTPGGELVWSSVTKMPLRDEKGRIVGIVGINRDITELKRAERELEQTHKRLVEASRQAGMAEVAIGVLHNVGNVLNSVNVSAGVIGERLRDSKVTGVAKLAKLLHEHKADVGRFLTEDERGRQVPTYLEQLAEQLERERTALCKELEELTGNIEHIKEIVNTQQNYAHLVGVTETVALPELMEDSLRIHSSAYVRHEVTLKREFDSLPTVSVDKHKVLQILVNLLSNAKYACDAGGKKEKQVTVRLKAGIEGRVKVEVADNGVGIAPENLTRIFSQGFTTRQGGHGFGLHSGALAARDLGGTLTVHSDGPGQGATFTLEFPLAPPHHDDPPIA
jgi:PAS domain S-box-containing protein